MMTADERRESRKEYYQKNKDKIAARSKEYYQKNKDDIREYYQKNKDKIDARNKEYYQKNKDDIREYYQKNRDDRLEWVKEYRKKNRDKILEHKKEYYQKNKDKIDARNKEYYQKNKDKILAHIQARRQSDPIYKFVCVCRSRISIYYKCKGISKSKHTMEMIGCTPTELRDHLQSQFTDGMTFENHGEWHIDHITPLASANTDEEIIKLCHYTNLQPLWAGDNWLKGIKINKIK